MPDPKIIKEAALAAGIDSRTAYLALVEGQSPVRRSKARTRFFEELARRGVRLASISSTPALGDFTPEAAR